MSRLGFWLSPLSNELCNLVTCPASLSWISAAGKDGDGGVAVLKQGAEDDLRALGAGSVANQCAALTGDPNDGRVQGFVIRGRNHKKSVLNMFFSERILRPTHAAGLDLICEFPGNGWRDNCHDRPGPCKREGFASPNDPAAND